MHRHGLPWFFSSSPRMRQLGAQTFWFLPDPMKCPKIDRVNQKGVGKLNQRIGTDFQNFNMKIQLYYTRQIFTKFL